MNLNDLVLSQISSHWKHIGNNLPITSPSVPILYFGDLNAYKDSIIKIITVGLSPSHNEFPYPNRFTRFKALEGLNIDETWTGKEVEVYIDSLNNYFHDNPYSWFNVYEPMLNGLNTSFYGSKMNTALHTDLCSPHATYPTWSKLSESVQKIFLSEGLDVWHQLVEFLKPDILLISIARKYTDLIRFRKSNWRTFESILYKSYGTPRAKPYHIEVSDCLIGDKKGFMVFGEAAQMPFGTLSTEIKRDVGKTLLKLF